MLQYVNIVKRELMKYPLSITTLMGIIYLSFFNTGGLNTTSLFAHFDKFAHFVMYAALCSILWYEYYKSHTETDRKRIFWGAIIAPTLFSGALEVFQGCFTEYRNGDFVDFLFNAMGVAFAALLAVYVVRPLMARRTS